MCEIHFRFLLLSVLIVCSHCFSFNNVNKQQKLINQELSGSLSGKVKNLNSSFDESPLDPDYPYRFTGRLWFSPSLVKKAKSKNDPKINIVSFFGWTLGGTVALEYDTSPIGPYREYVTMSAIVTKRGAFGQWGSRLYVSTKEAESICRRIWGVPAETANITFNENRGNDVCLKVSSFPDPDGKMTDTQNINVEGWGNTRVLNSHEDDTKRWGGIPVLWTPTIKALWAPLRLPFPFEEESSNNLPLHKLRLSASAIRIKWSGFRWNMKSDSYDEVIDERLGINLGVGLVVDNVLIEIGPQFGML